MTTFIQTKQHAVQDLLFTRIAKNYVKMITEPADLSTKDSFFKVRCTPLIVTNFLCSCFK